MILRKITLLLSSLSTLLVMPARAQAPAIVQQAQSVGRIAVFVPIGVGVASYQIVDKKVSIDADRRIFLPFSAKQITLPAGTTLTTFKPSPNGTQLLQSHYVLRQSIVLPNLGVEAISAHADSFVDPATYAKSTTASTSKGVNYGKGESVIYGKGVSYGKGAKATISEPPVVYPPSKLPELVKFVSGVPTSWSNPFNVLVPEPPKGGDPDDSFSGIFGGGATDGN